jgi:type VI secretion system protein ImpH
MASQDRRNNHALIAKLLQESTQFSVVQAIRLLEQLTLADDTTAATSTEFSNSPHTEIIRLHAAIELSFPATEIKRISQAPSNPATQQSSYDMEVNFMGLTGPAGVLPQSYTQYLLERLSNKDSTLKDFLDQFNHRALTFFYRAWRKYRLAINFEHSHYYPSFVNPFQRMLRALTGHDPDKAHQTIPPEVFLYYAGHFSHRPRNPLALVSILTDYFAVPVQLKSFQGHWLRLNPREYSCLLSQPQPNSSYAQLGKSTILGKKVWDGQSKFRLTIGPLSYQQFLQFLPTGNTLALLVAMTRNYVGLELQFDLELILDNSEVPHCQLSKTAGNRLHLGWNTWLLSTKQQYTPRVVISCSSVLTQHGFKG